MIETIRRRPLVAYFELAFAISRLGVSVLWAAGAGLIDESPASRRCGTSDGTS